MNLLTVPGLVWLVVVTQIPFVLTLVLSFVSWNVRRPDLPVQFNGIENYTFLFSDGEFYRVLVNTVLITGVGLVLSLILGFLLGLAFNRSFRGITVLISMVIIPYFIMEPVIGIVWKTLILSPSFGLNQLVSSWLGIAPISFFSSRLALLTIIILVVWQWSPFLFLILLAGLKSLPDEVMEAAKVDGAGPFRRVLSFTLPLMKPYFKVAAMFGLINILKVFGIIFVTTQGGPGIASANLPYYIYRTGFYDWQAGRSAAISVVTVIITLVLINLFFRFQGDVRKR
ncbi:MAG: carbohydrate ABC transporter permease [Propionibacteriaceae bacterium]